MDYVYILYSKYIYWRKEIEFNINEYEKEWVIIFDYNLFNEIDLLKKKFLFFIFVLLIINWVIYDVMKMKFFCWELYYNNI